MPNQPVRFLASLGLALAACTGVRHPPQVPPDAAAPPQPGRRAVFVEGTRGVRLALDVRLPDAVTTSRVHAVLRLTRYWRATEFRDAAAAAADPDEQIAAAYLAQGLAYVAVDARGTGASFGSNPGPWSPDEQADAARVLDWIAAQPWSSGKVAAIGTSYDANAALLASATGHRALAAVIARFPDDDPYAGIAFPGGLRNAGFLAAWAGYTAALDASDLCGLAAMRGEPCEVFRARVAGPAPVDEAQLPAAIAEHAGNLPLAPAFDRAEFRDDALGAGASLDAVAPYHAHDAIARAAVPTLITASWMDAGTAAGALDSFTRPGARHEVVIGAFSHAGVFDSDPLRAPRPTADPAIEAQFAEAIGFAISRASGAGPASHVVRYATLGDDTWRTTPVWPPATTRTRTFALGDGALVDGTPAAGVDRYAVDLSATTGPANRWLTPIDGSRVDYGDRAAADRKLLVYDSAPMANDLRITGTPVARLRLAASADDAGVVVYLEDVDPAGVVRYLTEGELRLAARATGAGGPGAERVTGRSYRRGDAQPYTRDTAIDLVIPLQPTSAKIRAGHRLRLAIAGGDAGTFAPVTPAGTQLAVHRGAGASRLELPIDTAP